MTFQKTVRAVYAWTDDGLKLHLRILNEGYAHEYRCKDGRWSAWGFRP